MILFDRAVLLRRNSYRPMTDLPKYLPRKKKEQSPTKVPMKEQNITLFSLRKPSFAKMPATRIVVSPSKKVPIRTPMYPRRATVSPIA